MFIQILAFIASMIPSAFFVIYCFTRKKNGREYKRYCRWCILLGASSFIGLSKFVLILQFAGNFIFANMDPLYQVAYQKYIIAALLEETFKCVMFFMAFHICMYRASWRDIVVGMCLSAAGFSIFETGVYGMVTTPGQMLVRGILLMHISYQFITAYGTCLLATKRRKWPFVLSFFIAVFLHGTYDFCLSDELNAVNENFGMISVALAFVAVAVDVAMIFFFVKTRKDPKFTAPLGWKFKKG